VSALTRILSRIFGGSRPAVRPAVRPPARVARYDAVAPDDEYSRKHWLAADGLSAAAANSPDVRDKLRRRSRYEKANNGYAKGLVTGRTNDTLGTGPRLQIELPEQYYDRDFQRYIPTGTAETSAADLARIVERRWYEWCETVGFKDDLRVMAEAEDTDGEAFAVFVTNPALLPTGPQIDLRLYEADQVATPNLDPLDPLATDGIRFDEAGNPVEYHFLRNHPGDAIGWAALDAPQPVPAHRVIHLFDRERPGQYRGIPILTPSLPLYSVLRRYTLAALGTAELGASIAGVIENPNAPVDPSGDDAPEIEAMDEIPFPRNALLTLHGGQIAKGFESKQPVPNYREFKAEVLTEAGRPASAPRNVSTGTSAEYNYSSGRLDFLPYQRAIKIRRERFERELLDRVFRRWLYEALLIPDYLPVNLPPVEEWEWRWHWDGFESIDPVKDATAQQIKKAAGLTTDACELAKEGIDWRDHYAQLAREKALRLQLGLEPIAVSTPATLASDDTEDDEDDAAEQDTAEQDTADEEETANV
jgi:lambda family phage portal protein